MAPPFPPRFLKSSPVSIPACHTYLPFGYLLSTSAFSSSPGQMELDRSVVDPHERKAEETVLGGGGLSGSPIVSISWFWTSASERGRGWKQDRQCGPVVLAGSPAARLSAWEHLRTTCLNTLRPVDSARSRSRPRCKRSNSPEH